MLAWLQRALAPAATLLFPPHCAVCAVPIIKGRHLCNRCADTRQRLERPFCERCSDPFDGAITAAFECPNCAGRKLHYEHAVAPYLCRAAVRQLIHAFKYGSREYLADALGEWICEALEDPRIRMRSFDALVPVPLHHVRQRERKFNQALLLAQALSRRCGKPVIHALRRIRYTSTQTKLERQERMENLRGAFRVRHTTQVKGSHLILVDDVFTTGSTVEECSRALCAAGAASIRVITVARG